MMKILLVSFFFILSEIFGKGICATFPPKDYAFLFPSEDHLSTAILTNVPFPYELHELTISVWVNHYSMGNSAVYISSVNPQITFGLVGAFLSGIGFSFPAVSRTQWVHYSFTWTSETGRWTVVSYVDGKKIGSSILFTNVTLTSERSATLVLGQWQTGGDFDPLYSFKGEMTEVNIWDSALSEQEVQKVYQSQLEGNIVAWSKSVWSLVNNISTIASTAHGLCGNSIN